MIEFTQDPAGMASAIKAEIDKLQFGIVKSRCNSTDMTDNMEENTTITNTIVSPEVMSKSVPCSPSHEEDLSLIEKAAKVLEARSEDFKPKIEFLQISDSPLSLFKNAKHAFERAMTNAWQTQSRELPPPLAGGCRVRARARLQNKFPNVVKKNRRKNHAQKLPFDHYVVVNGTEKSESICTLKEVSPKHSGRMEIKDLSGSAETINHNSLAASSTTPLSNTLPNPHPEDGPSGNKCNMPHDFTQNTSKVQEVDGKFCDFVTEANEDDGKMIEIHLYSEPKSVIQHRNRCIRKYQEKKSSQSVLDLQEGTDVSLTNIQWLGNMSGDTLVKGQQGRRMYITEKQIQMVQKRCGDTERPPYSYLHLIQMAINSKPDKKMTLREIYLWMETTFPFFKNAAKPGWKNSIRHNLSLYDIFVRESCSVDGKKCSYWTLKVPEISEEEVAAEMENAAENTPQTGPVGSAVVASAVRKYKTPRAIAPANMKQPPITYSDVVVAVPPSEQQPGRVPLLPKPTADTFTLIPVQQGGMIPVPPPNVQTSLLTSPAMKVPSDIRNSMGGMNGCIMEATPIKTEFDTSTSNDFTKIKKKNNRSRSSSSLKQQQWNPVHQPVTPGFQYSSYDSGMNLPCDSRNSMGMWATPIKTEFDTSTSIDFTKTKNENNQSRSSTILKQQRWNQVHNPVTPGFQYSSYEYDSGIDLRSMTERSSCSDFSPIENSRPKQKRPKQSRKPRQPKKIKQETNLENQENLSACKNLYSDIMQEGKAVADMESGFVSSLGIGFMSPLRNMLNTPPRKDMLATSTPVKNNFFSPKWNSPISFQMVTPVRNTTAAMPNSYDTLATPKVHHLTDLSFGFSTSPPFSPKNAKLKGRSLGLANGTESCATGKLTGITPLKNTGKDGNISGLSVNDSFGRILGDMQLGGNLLEDDGVMPFIDVKDLSWLNH